MMEETRYSRLTVRQRRDQTEDYDMSKRRILKTREEFEAAFPAYCAEPGTTPADLYAGNNREKTEE